MSPTAPVTPVRAGEWSDSGTSGADAGPAVERYTPAPEIRPDWTRTWDETTTGTPERWYEPAPAAAASAVPAKRRRTGGAGPLIAASLLSAILAAGGTVLALSAAGALDRPAPALRPRSHRRRAPAPSSPSPSMRRPRRSTSPRRSARPSCRSRSAARRRHSATAIIPRDRRRLRRHLRRNGWILTNHHVVEGSDQARRSSSRTAGCSTGTVYGIDTPDRPRDRQGRRHGPADRRDRRLRRAQGRPARGRHRQPARARTRTRSRAGSCRPRAARSSPTATRPSTTSSRPTPRSTPATRGGPLLDAGGDVIGINTAIASDSNGIGFAIPIDIATPIMAAGRRRPAADPAVHGHPSTEHRPRSSPTATSLPVTDGALVGRQRRARRNPSPASRPAARPTRRGLKDGDIIVSVDGTGHRRRASARRDAQPVRARRHGPRRDPARRQTTIDAPGDPRDAARRACRLERPVAVAPAAAARSPRRRSRVVRPAGRPACGPGRRLRRRRRSASSLVADRLGDAPRADRNDVDSTIWRTVS